MGLPERVAAAALPVVVAGVVVVIVPVWVAATVDRVAVGVPPVFVDTVVDLFLRA